MSGVDVHSDASLELSDRVAGFDEIESTVRDEPGLAKLAKERDRKARKIVKDLEESLADIHNKIENVRTEYRTKLDQHYTRLVEAYHKHQKACYDLQRKKLEIICTCRDAQSSLARQMKAVLEGVMDEAKSK